MNFIRNDLNYRTAGLPAQLKKSRRSVPNKKTLFLPQRRSEMILTSRPPVNFASNILGLKKTLEAKFYNGLQKKYKEQLVFNSKIITR
jgi:hypothetical protein